MDKQTYDRVAVMVRDRAAGMTYEQIGEKHGVTRQRVGQLISKWNKYNFKVIKTNGCAYKNLRKWMNDHCIDRSELARAVGVESEPICGYEMQNFRYMLLGRRVFPEDILKEMIAVTGLSKDQILVRGE